MDVLGGLTVVLLIVTMSFVWHVLRRCTPRGQLAARHGWRYEGRERYEGGDTRRYVNGERNQFEWRGGYSDGSSDDSTSFVGVDFEAFICVDDALRAALPKSEVRRPEPLCLLIESRGAFVARMNARERRSPLHPLMEKAGAWIARSPTAKIVAMAGLVAANATISGQDATSLWSLSTQPYDPYSDPTLQRVECGVLQFDDAFIVLTNDASATKQLVNASLAKACLDCAHTFDAPLRIRLRAGRVRIELANARFSAFAPAERFFLFGHEFARFLFVADLRFR